MTETKIVLESWRHTKTNNIYKKAIAKTIPLSKQTHIFSTTHGINVLNKNHNQPRSLGDADNSVPVLPK